jgi:hypothetical protein
MALQATHSHPFQTLGGFLRLAGILLGAYLFLVALIGFSKLWGPVGFLVGLTVVGDLGFPIAMSVVGHVSLWSYYIYLATALALMIMGAVLGSLRRIDATGTTSGN